MAVSLVSILKKVKQADFFPNYYEVLGLLNFSTYNPKKKLQRLQEVKNEILDLNAQTKLIRLINQADKTLRDQHLRLKYNQELKDYLMPKEKAQQKARNIPPERKQPRQNAKAKETNATNENVIKNSAMVLGIFHILVSLIVIGLNFQSLSWPYSIFLVFASFMVFALLKAIAIQGFSVILVEGAEGEENWGLLLIGMIYYIYNQELLICFLLCLLITLLVKKSFFGRYRIMTVVAPIICSILFVFSVYAYQPLREQYFYGGFKILETSFNVKTPKVVKTFAKVFTHCNIREKAHPDADKLTIASPGKVYEVIDTASRKDWYAVLLDQDTGFIHLNSVKGRIYKDTLTVVFER